MGSARQVRWSDPWVVSLSGAGLALALFPPLLAARAADPVPLARSPAAPDAGLAAAAEPLAAPSRFSEVRPGDWAYQALSQLVALDGCPAAAGRVGLDGGLPLSRYEAAALLQACLVTSGARTDLVRRLQLEFEQELAVLQGLADGLETRLGELQASQFAASTILWADARLWLGAVQYGGNQIDRARSTYSGQLLREALVLVYDVRLNFDTSFNGQDLLRVRLRSGNGGYSDFRSNTAPPLQASGVSPGSCQPGKICRNGQIVVDKLYYQRSIGDHLHLTVGSRVNQKDMLGIWPSVYGDNEVLLIPFDKAGAPGAYSDIKGSGIGLYWNQRDRAATNPGLVLSGVYVTAAGKDGNPSEGGLFTAAAVGAATAQLGYLGRGWGLAAAYTYNQAGAYDRAASTPLAAQSWPKLEEGLGGYVHSYGLSAFWQPLRRGWIPSINLGWGLSRNVYDQDGPYAASSLLAGTSQSWMLGLNWSDAFDSGSELGMAIGSPQFMTRYTNPAGEQGADDQALMLEFWYRYQATDWLSITPGLFWLPRPRGQLTASGSEWNSTPLPRSQGSSFGALGALLKLRFRF
ncbi:MAG: iron uptake porin [Cyanobacteria bacterium]|nr:iron uptake porin [Cyanobacteriota bacterium]